MYPLVRAIAVIFFLSLLLGVAVMVSVGERPAADDRTVPLSFVLVGLIFTGPAIAIYFWFWLRSREVERISRAATLLASGLYDIEPSSSHREVAELSRALEELRQTILSQKELHQRTTEVMQEILNGMGEGLLAIDRGRKVVLANRRFGELFGVAPMVGKPFLEVVRNAALVRAFDQALGGTPNVSRISLNVGSEERHLEMRILPMANSPDIAAVALLIDISPIVRLEKVRKDFLADFSHEVRTPLSGLRAAIETLETRKVEPEQRQQLERIISRQLKRIERLLDDIRQLSEIEAGEVVLQRQPVDLRQMLHDVCDEFGDQIDGSGINLHVEGDSTEASVDPTRIQQVFANLIDNAFKHARGATEIRVEVEDGPAESVARVIDNGEGIAVEEQERIFRRMYRIDSSRSQKQSGSGLGLAIAKHLVLLHGGSIHVQSAPGQGATFEVRLPKR